jgi:molybdopterin-guanine dinucleotide biosynthesis protein A
VAQVLPGLPVGIEVAADEAPDQGPLEGLAVGLAQLDGRAEAALVTGVDAALLVPALASRLASALGAAEIAAGVVAGWPQPLPAVYRVALAPRARALRLEGRSALRDLLSAVSVARVEEPQLRDADPELDSFRRLNTQDELERARAAARAAGEPL